MKRSQTSRARPDRIGQLEATQRERPPYARKNARDEERAAKLPRRTQQTQPHHTTRQETIERPDGAVIIGGRQ